MTYIRGGYFWATPVLEMDPEAVLEQWTRTMREHTNKMRTAKEATRLTMPRRLQRRLGLASPFVLLTVNDRVSLSTADRQKTLCSFDA